MQMLIVRLVKKYILMWLTCVAHIGLPAQLAPAVRAEVKVSEARAGLINFTRECALGSCLGGPGPCGQHLQCQGQLEERHPTRCCLTAEPMWQQRAHATIAFSMQCFAFCLVLHTDDAANMRT